MDNYIQEAGSLDSIQKNPLQSTFIIRLLNAKARKNILQAAKEMQWITWNIPRDYPQISQQKLEFKNKWDLFKVLNSKPASQKHYILQCYPSELKKKSSFSDKQKLR